MKFTLSEWQSIRCALDTALTDEEELARDLEEELKTNPDVLRDYLDAKKKIVELEGFIARIENSTI